MEKYWIGGLRKAVIDGDVDYGSMMAGQSVGLVDRIMPIAELFNELLTDGEATLQEVKAKLQ